MCSSDLIEAAPSRDEDGNRAQHEHGEEARGDGVEKMRKVGRSFAGPRVIALAMALAPVAAQAQETCSHIAEICVRHCAYNYPGFGRCPVLCSDALAFCKRDGCWRIGARRQCGYTMR